MSLAPGRRRDITFGDSIEELGQSGSGLDISVEQLDTIRGRIFDKVAKDLAMPRSIKVYDSCEARDAYELDCR